MNDELKTIKKLSGNINILYVEDNIGLCENMSTLLGKMFDSVLIAHDAEEGYQEYLKSKPKIIITDANMPNMNGFKMIKKIKAIDSDVKIIMMTAYDEKKHLHAAIKLGVFRYLNKPAKIPELVEALYAALTSIQREDNSNIFFNQLKSIFNYQNNIIVMMHNGEFILQNQRFNEFFEVDNLEDFTKKYSNLDKLLLEHKEFLYTTPSSNWQDTAISNPGKLFHTKIKNHLGENRHLILKVREVPEKDEHYILSFDDITELNMMALFDEDASRNDAIYKDKMAVLNLLQVVKDNSSDVKIHNFYRGLTIVNPAVLTDIKDDEFTLKTVNAQLKIVQMVKFMTLTSDVFPKTVICKSVKEIDSDSQTIVVNEMSFTPRSSTDRKYIRLEADEDHSCMLFYKKIKFMGRTSIFDISEVSAKIEINALPAGMVVGTEISTSITLKHHGKLISINTDATIYRIDENKRNYHIVIMFELKKKDLDNVRDYLANRQMALIREFKKINII